MSILMCEKLNYLRH